ncbi:C2 domain protein [Ancylostoma caninum]|uniref:C2 domain protein n=1 Tax=Ancylostoma caninum TaxID=29170 RepID=A0A368HAB2_ANCCA|nr:C2 domain protein [Ancylostoma caninum]
MANAFIPAQPCSKVYLTIKANKLRDMDTFSKSDPLCVVYQFVKHPDRNEEWIELGRTEIVWNCLNPEFATKILCDYFFEERQRVKFELYDADSMSSDLSKHDFLGYCDCYLAEIVSARTYTTNLGGLRGNCGSITISAEEVDEGSKEQAEFHVRATKLDRKDIFGSSDPFLRIYRIMDSGSRQLAHQTKHLTRTLNPEWAVFRVNLQILCGGDRRRPFLIECWDHEYDGSHQFIGSCEISAEEILTRTTTSIPLLNNDLFCRSLCCMAYQNSGILHFTHFQIVKSYSFLDYIQAGTQLDFTVAVDLTASNGDPRKSSSLHYISSKAPSQYEVAIRAVVEICQYYNKSKRFNAFGFGAITPGNRKASEVFNLNLSSTCEVFGLQGVLEAYHYCIPMVQLYGPTNFAPVVRNAARSASETLDGSRYQVHNDVSQKYFSSSQMGQSRTWQKRRGRSSA